MERQVSQKQVEQSPRKSLLMRRWVVMALLLSSMVFPSYLEARGAKRYLKKETTVDMKDMKRIFVGWVDLHPEEWSLHWYRDKATWAEVINGLNVRFQGICASHLPDRTVTGAKDIGDENTAGSDLYIRISRVRVDHKNKDLYLSIDFIDPKTNSELASIPVRPYYGAHIGFENFLTAALEEVGVKLEVEIMGALQKKK